MNNPETFNSDRMDEIAREAFCRAAQYGIEMIQETQKSKSALPQFEERIEALAQFMQAAGNAVGLEDKSDSGYDADDEV